MKKEMREPIDGTFGGMRLSQTAIDRFVNLRLAGCTLGECYRMAFDPTIRQSEATTLGNRLYNAIPQIKERLGEIQERVEQLQVVTRATHLYKLADIRDQAIEDKQFSAAVTAETHRGKVAGLYKPENSTTVVLGEALSQLVQNKEGRFIDVTPKEVNATETGQSPEPEPEPEPENAHGAMHRGVQDHAAAERTGTRLIGSSAGSTDDSVVSVAGEADAGGRRSGWSFSNRNDDA